MSLAYNIGKMNTSSKLPRRLPDHRLVEILALMQMLFPETPSLYQVVLLADLNELIDLLAY